MPVSTKRSIDRARVFDPEGAGGELLGEPAATPSRAQRRSKLSSHAADDAVDRARLREMVKRPDGERISDEVIDQLLAGALSDLKTRGVSDILICCVDGLKGFPEAIEAIFPATTVQTCVVHLIGQACATSRGASASRSPVT